MGGTPHIIKLVKKKPNDDFDGGKFVTWPKDAKGTNEDVPIIHEVTKGDGVLFRSEDLHNVLPVTRGTRRVLVLELWAGATNQVDRSR